MHPQVLSGRGLAAAIRDVAGRSPVPITVQVDLPRLRTPVEVNAYYVVAEALANLAKHSQASHGSVTVSLAGDVLRLEIRDDGVGGALDRPGGGLAGLADRMSTLDGKLFLSSPPGGPTVLRAEIPLLDPPGP